MADPAITAMWWHLSLHWRLKSRESEIDCCKTQLLYIFQEASLWVDRNLFQFCRPTESKIIGHWPIRTSARAAIKVLLHFLRETGLCNKLWLCTVWHMPQRDIAYDYVAPSQTVTTPTQVVLYCSFFPSFSVIFCAPCPLTQYRVTNWRYPLVNLSFLCFYLSLCRPEFQHARPGVHLWTTDNWYQSILGMTSRSPTHG